MNRGKFSFFFFFLLFALNRVKNRNFPRNTDQHSILSSRPAQWPTANRQLSSECRAASPINAAIINNITLTITHDRVCFIAIYRIFSSQERHVSPERCVTSRRLLSRASRARPTSIIYARAIAVHKLILCNTPRTVPEIGSNARAGEL